MTSKLPWRAHAPRPATRRSFASGLVRVSCLLLVGLLSLGAVGCGSTRVQARDVEPPIRVTYRDFRSGLEFVMVNDAWLVKLGVEGASPRERQTQFQSTPMAGGQAPKIMPDQYLDLYVQSLAADLKLEPLYLAEPLPANSAVYTTGFEIMEGNSVRHFGNGPTVNISIDQKVNYGHARTAYFEIYNSQFVLQAQEDPVLSGQR